MPAGLDATFELLSKTSNQAAIQVLVAALGSPSSEMRRRAVRGLSGRREPAARRELLRAWESLSDAERAILTERPGRLTGVIRDAVLGSDGRMCAVGCDAAVRLLEFDLMPALINAAEDEANPHADLTARTVAELAEALYEELAGPRDYRERRDPQFLRRNALGALDKSLRRIDKHHRREFLEAFLLMADRDNATLKRILQNPHESTYLAVRDVLLHSGRGGVMRLLLSFVDDPHAPLSALNVVSRRDDEPFLRHFLQKVAEDSSSSIVQHNLKRMEHIPWIEGDLKDLELMNDELQRGAVELVMASGLNRLQKLEFVQHVLRNGKAGGRRAACAALAEFQGSEANQLTVDALEDSDPQVQANALVQLRERSIPGAMTRLIELVDSPHQAVQTAARDCLEEFSFKRFLSAFDMLDDDVRQTTGPLVKKVDPRAEELLTAELESTNRSRRLRALSIAPYIDAVPALEGRFIAMLSDEDHLIRSEAATALGCGGSARARVALREALLDRSVSVREAAERSLQQLAGIQAKRQTAPPLDATTTPFGFPTETLL